MARIFLTGGEGFIGSNLYNKLLDEGHEVHKHIGDIRDIDSSCTDDVQPYGYDFVIHLAAMAGVRASHLQPDEYWSVNVDGSKKVFETVWGPILRYYMPPHHQSINGGSHHIP